MGQKHDEIVLWLMERVDTLDIYSACKIREGWLDSERALISQHLPDMPLARRTGRITEKRLESVLVDKYGKIIGYADLLVMCEFDYYEERSRHYDHVAGRWVEAGVDMRTAKRTLLFEVKPSINDLGAVIRQIRRYTSFDAASQYFVCSPDQQYKSVLEAQGIQFLHADMGSPELPF